MPKRRNERRRRSEMAPRVLYLQTGHARARRLLISWALLAAHAFITHLKLSSLYSRNGNGFSPMETQRKERTRTPVLLIIVLGRAEKGLIMLCTTVLRSAASAVAHLSRLVSIFGCLCLPLSLLNKEIAVTTLFVRPPERELSSWSTNTTNVPPNSSLSINEILLRRVFPNPRTNHRRVVTRSTP